MQSYALTSAVKGTQKDQVGYLAGVLAKPLGLFWKDYRKTMPQSS